MEYRREVGTVQNELNYSFSRNGRDDEESLSRAGHGVHTVQRTGRPAISPSFSFFFQVTASAGRTTTDYLPPQTKW